MSKRIVLKLVGKNEIISDRNDISNSQPANLTPGDLWKLALNVSSSTRNILINYNKRWRIVLDRARPRPEHGA